MKEKENILDIIIKSRKAIKEKDVFTLKKLSDRTVHVSSIYQDPDNIAVAVVIYSLAKLTEREKYKTLEGWENYEKIFLNSLDNAVYHLKVDNLEMFRKDLIEIEESVEKLSGKLKLYIQSVFRKAHINKASRIYEHGISQAKAASILGITVWELAEYAGTTGISDVDLSITKSIKERLNIAEKMFTK